MTDPHDDDLDAAYALSGPDDVRAYYAAWAGRYDHGFARGAGYDLPGHVAAAFVAAGGRGPVIDLGAGTGLVAEALVRAGVGPVDALDLSSEMLAVASAKGVYRRAVLADLMAPLPLPDAAYAGIVSAGTFTRGHVGPGALPGLLRIAAPGALVCLSVHEGVWLALGFPAAFRALGPAVRDFAAEPVPIYSGAAGAHAGDRAFIVRFRTAAAP